MVGEFFSWISFSWMYIAKNWKSLRVCRRTPTSETTRWVKTHLQPILYSISFSPLRPSSPPLPTFTVTLRQWWWRWQWSCFHYAFLFDLSKKLSGRVPSPPPRPRLYAYTHARSLLGPRRELGLLPVHRPPAPRPLITLFPRHDHCFRSGASRRLNRALRQARGKPQGLGGGGGGDGCQRLRFGHQSSPARYPPCPLAPALAGPLSRTVIALSIPSSAAPFSPSTPYAPVRVHVHEHYQSQSSPPAAHGLPHSVLPPLNPSDHTAVFVIAFYESRPFRSVRPSDRPIDRPTGRRTATKKAIRYRNSAPRQPHFDRQTVPPLFSCI